MLKIKGSRIFKSSLIGLVACLLASSASYVDAKNTIEKRNIKKHQSISHDEYLLYLIEKSSIDEKVKDVLKNIARTTTDESVIRDIELAIANDKDEACNHCIASAITKFSHSLEKVKYKEAYDKAPYDSYLYQSFLLDDVAILNNFSLDVDGMPSQLSLLTRVGEMGDYSIYEVNANRGMLHYVIAYKDEVLLFCDSSQFYLTKGLVPLISLEDFLNNISLNSQIKEEYTYFELFEGLTFDISEKFYNYSNKDKFSTKNVLVIDCDRSIGQSQNLNQTCYFIKYACPYVFAEGADIYKDVSNPDAKITIDKFDRIFYVDNSKNMCLFDEGIASKENRCLITFEDFMRSKIGVFASASPITDEMLKELGDFYKNEEAIKDELSLNAPSISR